MDFRHEWFQALERYHRGSPDPSFIYFPLCIGLVLAESDGFFPWGLRKWQEAPVHLELITYDLKGREVPMSQFPYIKAQGRL